MHGNTSDVGNISRKPEGVFEDPQQHLGVETLTPNRDNRTRGSISQAVCQAAHFTKLFVDLMTTRVLCSIIFFSGRICRKTRLVALDQAF